MKNFFRVSLTSNRADHRIREPDAWPPQKILAFSTDTGIHLGFCVKSHFFPRVRELYYIRHIITPFRDQCITGVRMGQDRQRQLRGGEVHEQEKEVIP